MAEEMRTHSADIKLGRGECDFSKRCKNKIVDVEDVHNRIEGEK